MPATISHALSMTTPDDPLYENRPSHWNATHALTLSATGSEIVGAFSNANGLSFGLSAGAITASHNALTTAALSNHSHGNPSLALTNLSGTTASNSAGFTLSLSAGAGGAGDGVNILAAGTQTANTTGSVLFNNANGISFGMSNNSVITASHNALTTAMASNRGSDFVQATAAFAGTSASGTIASNGISISIGPYLTTAAQSNHAHGVSFTSGSVTFQTLSFTNSNGISFNSGTQGIFASHNALTTARASTDAIGLNTALTAGPLAWTVNSSGLSLNAGSAAGTTSGFGGNLLSASMTHNTAGLNLSLNHPAWLTTAAQSNHSHGNPTLNLTNLSGTTASNSAGFTLSLSAAAPGGGGAINVSAGTTSGNLQTLQFDNANGISFQLNGSTVTASHNGLTTAAASDHSHGNPTLALTNLSGTTASASNGFTLSLSAGAAGAAAPISYWQNLPLMWTALATTSAMQSTSIAIPLMIQENLSVNRMRFVRSITAGGTSVATVANTSWGFTQSQTHNFAFYSFGSGASSNSLQLYTSTQFGVTMTLQGSVGAASNNLSVNRTINAPMSTGNSAFTFSTAPAGSASLPFATTDMSNFISGIRLHDSQFAVSFPANLYFLVHGISTTGATGGATAASALTAATVNWQMLMYPCINSNIASFGTSAQSFNMALVGGAGSFSTAGGGTTGSIDTISKFSSIVSNPIPYFIMDRLA